MDDFLTSYFKRCQQRLAIIETYGCLTCRELAKKVLDLEEKVRNLQLEIAEILRRNLK